LLPAEHRQKSRPIRTLQRCRSMANVGAEHLPKIDRTRSELHFLNAAAQTRVLSVARIRLDSRQSVRPFKRIFCATTFLSSSLTWPASQSGLCVVVSRCGRTGGAGGAKGGDQGMRASKARAGRKVLNFEPWALACGLVSPHSRRREGRLRGLETRGGSDLINRHDVKASTVPEPLWKWLRPGGGAG
jgi:hypothetical protein